MNNQVAFDWLNQEVQKRCQHAELPASVEYYKRIEQIVQIMINGGATQSDLKQLRRAKKRAAYNGQFGDIGSCSDETFRVSCEWGMRAISIQNSKKRQPRSFLTWFKKRDKCAG